MTTEEMILAFRQAKKQGYIPSVSNYAYCTSIRCAECPASKTCEYLSKTKDLSKNYDTFKTNFDILIRPHLKKYTMRYIKKYYPELFI